jgi:hypothetical protein
MRHFLVLNLLLIFLTPIICQESDYEVSESVETWASIYQAQLSPDSIIGPDSLTHEQLRAWVNRLVSQTNILKTGFERELSYATYRRENLQNSLTTMRREKTASDSLVSATQMLFVASKNHEKQWKNLVEKTEKSSDDANRLTKMSITGIRIAIVNINKDIDRLFKLGVEINKNNSTNGEKSAEIEPNSRQKASKAAIDYKQYNRGEDPLFNPPAEKCHFAFQGRDEMTGEQRFEVESELFFTFTNNFMKNHLRDRPHIIGNVNLVGLSNGKKYINLVIQINESSAKRSFGGLNAGNRMTIKFIDGTIILLENVRTDEGVTNETDNFTTFRGTFFLDKEQLSAVSKQEIDRVRLAWNTGFEDYEIYNVDVLKRQATCLFK